MQDIKELAIMQDIKEQEFPDLPELPDEESEEKTEIQTEKDHERDIYFFFNKLQSPWQNLFIDIRDCEQFKQCHPRYTINIAIGSVQEDIRATLQKDIEAQHNLIAFLYIYTNDHNKERTRKHCAVIQSILKINFTLFPQMFVFSDKDACFLQKYPFLCESSDEAPKKVEAPQVEPKYRELLRSIARPKKKRDSYMELYSLRVGFHLEYPEHIINDRLFLGDYNAATRKPLLRNLGITHIVNCTSEENEFEKDEELRIKYLQIPINDSYEELIALYFEDAIVFIDKAMKERKENKIFVHCRAGVSRSSTIVIVYLMKRHSMSMDDALQYVQNRRSCIDPNPGFRIQLAHYEKNGYTIHEQTLRHTINNMYEDLYAKF